MLYYANRISENIARSDEGYLICRGVPVARSGTQRYLASELGLPPPERLIPVMRPESEVFSPACMASFEGKPVTDGHPPGPDGVTAANIRFLQKGHAQNIRRGKGREKQLLLADLVITDPDTVARVLQGRREISCGYTYTLAEEKGRPAQREIRGNHIAIVDKGRAGPRVAIRDSMAPIPERDTERCPCVASPMPPSPRHEAERQPSGLTGKAGSEAEACRVKEQNTRQRSFATITRLTEQATRARGDRRRRSGGVPIHPLLHQRSVEPMQPRTRTAIRKLVGAALRGSDLEPADLPEVMHLMSAVLDEPDEPEAPETPNAVSSAPAAAAVPDSDTPASAVPTESADCGSTESESAARAESDCRARDGDISARLDRIVTLLEKLTAGDTGAPPAPEAELSGPADTPDTGEEANEAASDPSEQRAHGASESGVSDAPPAEAAEADEPDPFDDALNDLMDSGGTEQNSEFLSSDPAAEPNGGVPETEPSENTETAEESEKTAAQARDQLVRAAIRAVKPVIAKLPVSSRAAASDAAIRALRACSAAPASPASARNTYAALAAGARRLEDDREIGRRIMEKRNINCRKEA